jgi:putative peptidoglycan lipid II flippase
MARMAAEGRLAELNRLLNDTLRYLCIVLPFAVLIIVLREEIVTLLYMRGKFTHDDVLMTAPVLGCLMLGAIAFASQTVVNRGFYAIQNTLLPAAYGTLAVVLSLPLYYLGMRWMGLAGVGLAVSASAFAQVALLFVIWNKRSENEGSRAVYGFFGKMVLLAIPLWTVLQLLRHLLVSRLVAATMGGSLATTAIVSAVFVLLLLILGYGFRIREITRILERLPGWPVKR